MKLRLAAFALASLALGGCDMLDDIMGDGGLGGLIETGKECTVVCAKIEQCNVDPPKASLGGFNSTVSNNSIANCATNCADTTNRVRNGYSDCQIECIKGAGCGEVADCWKASTSTYKRFCGSPNTKPVGPKPDDEDAPSIDNGTQSGNGDADDILEDPVINESVDESGTIINYGDNPPELRGRYTAVGSIDNSRNARPTGSPINTQICFLGVERLSTGPTVRYCERGVPGAASAPVTGDGDKFTLYLDFRPEGFDGTILFSGTFTDEDHASDVEALVTYTYGRDIWEHSVTQWERQDNDCTCPF